MPRSRDGYRVSAQNLQELVTSLNFILSRVADRMDKIEGIRGTATIESNLIVGEGSDDVDAARIDDLTSEIDSAIATHVAESDPHTQYARKAANETITGDYSFTGNVYVKDATSTTIHSLE